MNTSNIPLEGRTRLPGKIQDCIQDCGLIVSHILASSRSNEALGGAIKNFASMDSTVEHSAKVLISKQQVNVVYVDSSNCMNLSLNRSCSFLSIA
ncbi:unnamed protein product [Thelazia callipaeda]|uniref:BLOC-1-related complex subunit 7 n=1 Tax=Thelazia callipaeda TaxID=103827 RepID=A0A0N5D385_THECL|nr:unnamed protein product [Thelazia callipaeda]